MNNNRLISIFLPCHFNGCFSKNIVANVNPLTVDALFHDMFCNFPAWVSRLLSLRDTLVKPFGLEVNTSFADHILARNDEEIMLGSDDKHLDFRVSVYCSKVENGVQRAEVRTLVRFHNVWGRVYFGGIWIFHKLIVASMFHRALNK